MHISWPEGTTSLFERETLTARHDNICAPMFQDEALADLLDRYPRESLGIYTFPRHGEGLVKAAHGRANDLSGAELIQAVKTQKIWLNLRSVNKTMPEYSDLSDSLFSDMETATGKRIFKRDIGILISSPNIHVHYHLDIPLVCLVQLRGTKTLYLYPAKAPFATDEQIEAVALKERDEEVHFEHRFEAEQTRIALSPGMAVTWPQNAPHRVQNDNCMNVSLSCEFMTAAALVRANAIYANGLIRRRLGGQPRLPARSGPNMFTRAALARAIKLFNRALAQSPTPITFELAKHSLSPVPCSEPLSEGA